MNITTNKIFNINPINNKKQTSVSKVKTLDNDVFIRTSQQKSISFGVTPEKTEELLEKFYIQYLDEIPDLKNFTKEEGICLTKNLLLFDYLKALTPPKYLNQVKNTIGNKSIECLSNPNDDFAECTTGLLTQNGIKTGIDLAKFINLYNSKNINNIYKYYPYELMKIYSSLQEKSDINKFPDILLCAYQELQDSPEEERKSFLNSTTTVIKTFDCNNTDDFANKFNYLAADYNNFEYIEDIFYAITDIARGYSEKTNLLYDLSDKHPDDLLYADAEDLFFQAPEIVDYFFEKNEGNSLDGIEELMEYGINKSRFNDKTLSLIRPYYNNFESKEDYIKFYKELKENEISVQQFNTLFSKNIVSKIENPISYIRSKSVIVQCIKNSILPNPSVANAFYSKYTDILNAAAKKEDCDYDMIEHTCKFLKDYRISDSKDFLKKYNYCNKTNKKELSEDEVVEFLDLMRFYDGNLSTFNAKHKQPLINYLKEQKQDFQIIQPAINDFLNENKSWEISYLSDVSIFNEYKNKLKGKSETEIKEILNNIIKYNIQDNNDYNKKLEKFNKLNKYFQTKNDTTSFITNNKIRLEENEEDEKYLNNCIKILDIIYDKNSPDKSLKEIKDLSESKFLYNSKNYIENIIEETKSPLVLKETIKAFADKNVTNYVMFKRFAKKYGCINDDYQKAIDFLNQIPKGINFAQEKDLINELSNKLEANNIPFEITFDNLKNITHQDLEESKKQEFVDIGLLNKLMGLKEDSNPILSLKNVNKNKNHISYYKVADELVQNQYENSEHYTKIIKLLDISKKSFDLSEDCTDKEYTNLIKSYLPPNFHDFICTMNKTRDNKELNMSLHSRLRIIERFLLNDNTKSIDELFNDKTKEKLDNLIDSIYYQKPILIKKSNDGKRILTNSIFEGEIIENVFDKNGGLITTVKKGSY